MLVTNHVTFFFLKLFVHFFCSSKRNEPKKRSPEIPTAVKTGACYTGLIGATVFAAVRTISGLPSRLNLEKYVMLLFIIGFQTASENFGRAERKKIALWAILAKEPACRDSDCLEACCGGL